MKELRDVMKARNCQFTDLDSEVGCLNALAQGDFRITGNARLDQSRGLGELVLSPHSDPL